MSKVLVNVYIPEVEEKYEAFIPVNKKINTITELLKKSVNELSGGHYPLKEECLLYNRDNGKMYDINMIVKNTDIRNGTSVILM